jgi:hypothetical protein
MAFATLLIGERPDKIYDWCRVEICKFKSLIEMTNLMLLPDLRFFSSLAFLSLPLLTVLTDSHGLSLR